MEYDWEIPDGQFAQCMGHLPLAPIDWTIPAHGDQAWHHTDNSETLVDILLPTTVDISDLGLIGVVFGQAIGRQADSSIDVSGVVRRWLTNRQPNFGFILMREDELDEHNCISCDPFIATVEVVVT